MRKVNGKLIGKLNVFALIITICLAILFSGFTDFNQVHADETQDVEVTNLVGRIGGGESVGLSFNLKINRRVKQGEEIVLNLGYDKVDKNDDLYFNRSSYGEISIKKNDGSKDIIGTVMAYGHSNVIKFIFNKKAENYDVIDIDLSFPHVIYDITAFSGTTSNLTLKLPFYLTMDGKNITKKEAFVTRVYEPYTKITQLSNGFISRDLESFFYSVYVGHNAKSGDIIVEYPNELVANIDGINLMNCNCFTIKKPDINNTLIKARKLTKVDDNSLSIKKIDGNKVVIHFDKDKYKSEDIEGITNIVFKYKDGFSYQDDPARIIKIDYTGIGGVIKEEIIKKAVINTGGTGTILDVSKYQPEASPITVHKGDELSNKMITDHVIIKDKDGKTVKAEDINATKTRVDNNKIDTNTVGNYKATVNVEYKDGSTENVTVPIKVIDNVIPNLPDENGKNPEKPDGYVTVTMNAGQHGMLAKGEAKEYFVNPGKVVTIPAKDAIGKLGYKFSKWDSPLKAQFKNDKTINAKYKQLPDVIPNVPDHNGKKPEKPDGYVTVVVDPGNNGKLDPRDAGEYFVNPTKEVTIPIHNAVPNDGYKFNKWSPSKTGHFDHDMTIKAKYLAKGNANKPQTGDNGIEIPLAVLISTIGMAFVAVKTKKHI